MTDGLGAAMAWGLGLCIGSFVNVVIHRLPLLALGAPDAPGLAAPGSRCPHCLHPLAWHELIPVWSWLRLRGRCAHCQAPISWRYPAIELSVALLWLACLLRWGVGAQALGTAVFCTALLALACIDWDTTLLPDALTQPLLWLGLGMGWAGWTALTLSNAVAGAVCGYASLWLVASAFALLTGKEGMGAGDFKLLAAVGAWLGPLALIPVVLIASVSGAVVGLWLQRRARLREGGYLPFGPFLALGAALTLFAGDALQAFWLGGSA